MYFTNDEHLVIGTPALRVSPKKSFSPDAADRVSCEASLLSLLMPKLGENAKIIS